MKTHLYFGLGKTIFQALPCTIIKGLPLSEFSLSNDSDREPREENAESTEDTPESLLSLEASLDSEALRLSSSGSSVCEIPESSWDNNSERLKSLADVGSDSCFSWHNTDIF